MRSLASVPRFTYATSFMFTAALAFTATALHASAAEPILHAAPNQIDSIVWTEQQKVSGSDAAAGDELSTVLIYADHAFVGDPAATIGSNSHQGAVYVFGKSGSTWIQTQKLTASDGAALDFFGNAIAFDPSGGGLVIGASNKTVGTHAQQGAVYTFANSSGTWIQTQKLVASDGQQSDAFGYSVGVSSQAVFVGAPGKDKSAVMSAGAAYVFQGAGGSRVQTQELWGDAASAEGFGHSIAINGSTTFIGAPYYYDGNNDVGGVFVFVQQSCVGGTTCWNQQQLLVPPTISQIQNPDSNFGASIATAGTTLMIGAPYASIGYPLRSMGVVDVYGLSGGVWSYSQQLMASDRGANNTFGMGLATNGSVALIGAPRTSSPGAVYSFELSGGTWSQQQEFGASDGTTYDGFGDAISMSGTTALIDAFRANVGSNSLQGAGYFFSH